MGVRGSAFLLKTHIVISEFFRVYILVAVNFYGFCFGGSLQSTEQIICPSQLCGINIFWVTWLFLLWWHAKLKFSRIFQKNPIFSETIAPIDKLQKPTSPIFLRSSRLWTSVFLIRPAQFAQIQKNDSKNNPNDPLQALPPLSTMWGRVVWISRKKICN